MGTDNSSQVEQSHAGGNHRRQPPTLKTGLSLNQPIAPIHRAIRDRVMNRNHVSLLVLSLCLTFGTANLLAATEKNIPNPNINYDQFLRDAQIVAKLRAERRITEAEFIRMAQDPNTVVLDARSAEKYRQLHIKGAKNLSLPDVTAAELAKLIPDRSTRILIYCNNNFEDEVEAFPTKAVSASLNIYTFNTLYSYGYKNVYELGPLIDIHQSQLPFVGEQRDRAQSRGKSPS